MRVLIIGYTQRNAYAEFKEYVQNRRHFTNGQYIENEQRFVSDSGVTVEYMGLTQHRKDGLSQYKAVYASPLALKYMKPSDLDWIQSLMIMGGN
jgi:hypothetical protein